MSNEQIEYDKLVDGVSQPLEISHSFYGGVKHPLRDSYYSRLGNIVDKMSFSVGEFRAFVWQYKEFFRVEDFSKFIDLDQREFNLFRMYLRSQAREGERKVAERRERVLVE